MIFVGMNLYLSQQLKESVVKKGQYRRMNGDDMIFCGQLRKAGTWIL
jgi:hypothetical protein